MCPLLADDKAEFNDAPWIGHVTGCSANSRGLASVSCPVVLPETCSARQETVIRPARRCSLRGRDSGCPVGALRGHRLHHSRPYSWSRREPKSLATLSFRDAPTVIPVSSP